MESNTNEPIERERLERAYEQARAALFAERTPQGHWTGELSTSALSTATAVSALTLVLASGGREPPGPESAERHDGHSPMDPATEVSTVQGANAPRSPDPTKRHAPGSPEHLRALIASGIAWLAAHQNDDGGFGDTVKSFSNISTSMLIKAAFHITMTTEQYPDAVARLEEYLKKHCGATTAEQAEAIRARYGKDRTFAVPILMNCALAGFVPWNEVLPLPFELACFPQSWFRFLKMPVVSYALPALIAVGMVIHRHRGAWFPFNLIRRLAIPRALRVLEKIQPSSGGFLEATPLTSFVTMSLAACGRADHPVVKKAVEFIAHSVRPDGSWPIDSNLSTFVTTLAVNALAEADDLDSLDNQDAIRDWLLGQQFTERHPYTGADPGGWGWTDLPGSVPDADDTPGALLALARWHDGVRLTEEHIGSAAIEQGLTWLRDLQNRDGGWPTFCRGWGTLPFDRSGSDLTAHALRAFAAWQAAWLIIRQLDEMPKIVPEPGVKEKIRVHESHVRAMLERADHFDAMTERGFAYLARSQRPDGSWLPLWFGNQHAPDDENPTYGTARVLAAYRDQCMMDSPPAKKGIAWLLANQNVDGGWGAGKGTPSSIEETSLALSALIDLNLASGGREPPGPESPFPVESSTPPHATTVQGANAPRSPGRADGDGPRTTDHGPLTSAVNRGLRWLVERVEAGGLGNPAPIGFYFAKLWYFEKLYPIVFSVAALGRARRQPAGPPA